MFQTKMKTLENSPARNVPAIVTLLVNWNGCDDTIACVKSLFASDYPSQYVVVVDNGSKDGSLAKLATWAHGHLSGAITGTASARHATGCEKPIPFATLCLDDLAEGRGWDSGIYLFLIDAQRNHGFAGGVNIGLRFALANPSVQYVWVLNNDTVVAPDCLSRMWERMSAEPRAGMCGSRLVYWQRNVTQAFGGARFNPWLGRTRLIGNQQPANQWVDAGEIERCLDHLSGASMLVSRRFLEDVGLMDEGYFLYFEEMDWAMRGKGRYQLLYADNAVVQHKDGASIGSNGQRAKVSPLSAFFMIRSRLRFTRKFHPWGLPTVILYCMALAARALFEGHYGQANAMIAALCGLSAEKAIGWRPD